MRFSSLRYLIKQGWKNMAANRLMTFASIGVLTSCLIITGIAGRRNFTIITVQKRNINISVTLRQTLEIMDRYKAAVEHINLGLDSFALVTATTALGDGLYDVIAEIQKTCHPDDVRVQDGLALVAAVGRKMTFRPGTSGKLFQALGEHGVNIRTIAQGADELSIIVGVENSQF